MKKLYQYLLLLALASFVMLSPAQTPTTQGTEFWLSFMRNGYRSANGNDAERLTLIASAKRACSVTVTNPYTSLNRTFSIDDNAVVTYIISDVDGYNNQQGGTANKGIHVTSTDTISLYIANEAENSYDAANVLPVQALGSHYMIQSNKSLGEQQNHYNENRASFLVIATQDNTEVIITPSCQTWDGHAAGVAYQVNLNAGQCYHVLNRDAGTASNNDGDFTGTLVTSASNKPIAVFNGNCITSVPNNVSAGYDHVFEQAMPTDYWGKRFVVTSIYQKFSGMSADVVKITALYDNTTVTRDGSEFASLNSGQSATFNLELNTNPCSYLEADNPIGVSVYNHSHGSGYGTNYGDPSMVWISPVEQTVFEVTFSTFQAEHVEDHFVNLVCYTDHSDDVFLDGVQLNASFQPVAAAPEFSYSRFEVQPGAHTLRCPGGFVAYVYGYGDVEGYAYTVGSSAKVLTKQLYVDGVLSTELPEGYTICQNEQVEFRVETNYDIDHVTWNFGDGDMGTGIENSHRFTTPGSFNVESVIYREMNNEVLPFDTLSVSVHVNPIQYDTIYSTSCELTPGVYYDTLQSTQGCDSIVCTIMAYGDANVVEIEDVACQEYPFRDSIFTTSGRHEYLVEKQDGCDSLYVFNLTIGRPPEDTDTTIWSCEPFGFIWGEHLDHTMDITHQFTTAEGCVYDSVIHFILIEDGSVFDTIVACDSYSWSYGTHTETLTESGDYVDTIIGANGCESYFHLHLTLFNTPPFNEIKGLGNVPVATNYWPAEYYYFLDDSTGMDTNEVIWELSDNENGEWQFRPHGASCTVITYTMGTKVLSARSVGHGSCDKEVSFTINCSGYDVEEAALSHLKVYPNPVRKELIVEGEQLTGVVIYNLLGQKVKVVETTQESMLRVEVDDLPQGLYLIQVFTRYGNKTQIISVTE